MPQHTQEFAITPIRVAIIGSGPSGFYAADALFKQNRFPVEIDMFERLPTPFGLVRGGVAPDHPKIKAVTKVYERIAEDPRFRFLGNVGFGRDVTYADLKHLYHAVIYAVGAQTDRQMGIPGEDLAGSYAATDFVGWYNAHPDYRDLKFDLSLERAVVVGNGNVAMDVVRILARTPEELHKTDIADYALDALAQSNIREIIVLGRRGPAQAAFTNPEIKELAELSGADVYVPSDAIRLDPLSQEYIRSGQDRTAERNVQILTQYANKKPTGKPRRITMRFLVSPVEIIGTDHVEAVKIVRNELFRNADDVLRPRPTNQYETIPAGLVFRSIGYMGLPLPGLPFDDTNGTIPNVKGRVMTTDRNVRTGDYVVGWIKRGPIGIIGTNKPDAVETVESIIADAQRGALPVPPCPEREAVDALLRQRSIDVVTFADWKALDTLEVERGKAVGRPRVKFSRVEDMLAALDRDRHRAQAEALT